MENVKIASDPEKALSVLEGRVYAALETYSNVHRGSGYFSQTTSLLFERAREAVLGYFKLGKKSHTVIFCTPFRASILAGMLDSTAYRTLSSKELGLSIGVVAMAVKKKALPAGIPFHKGGGSARLVSPGWVVWGNSPGRFEAGTPPIINIIAFVTALGITREKGPDIFRIDPAESISSDIFKDPGSDGLSGENLLSFLKRNLIGQDVNVPTTDGIKTFRNLDYAATTPALNQSWTAFRGSLLTGGNEAMETIEKVRIIIREMLGAPEDEYDILFTSNTTESINILTGGLKYIADEEVSPVVLDTILEHNSNELPWRYMKGFTLQKMEVNSEGFIDFEALENQLSSRNQDRCPGGRRIRIITVTAESNVLGTCNDLTKTAEIAHKYHSLLAVDAAQIVAHRKINMEESGIDILSFSAHKVYAPFGTGVLVFRKGSLQYGESEYEQIKSSGRENVAGIAALGVSLAILHRTGMELIQEEEKELTRYALEKLSEVNGITIHGIHDPYSPVLNSRGGVISFSIKGLWPNVIADHLSAKGIGIRFGCHCAHILIKKLLRVPPALQKFQRVIAVLFHSVNFPGVARISFGLGCRKEDIDFLVSALKEINPGISKGDKLFRSEIIKFARKRSDIVFGEISW